MSACGWRRWESSWALLREPGVGVGSRPQGVCLCGVQGWAPGPAVFCPPHGAGKQGCPVYNVHSGPSVSVGPDGQAASGKINAGAL